MPRRALSTGLMALATALALIAPSTAAPWKAETFKTEVFESFSAVQSDSAEDYFLVVQCIVPGKWNISVDSPIDWDDEASYAPAVPAIFIIDGVEIDTVAFTFDDRSFTEAIVAYASGQEAAFGALLDAIASAGSEIDLRYFDKSTSFSPEGYRAAIAQTRESCG